MPVTKVKSGSNMYQGWVTHTHSHLAGKCPHACGYCYVQAMERKFGAGRYAGALRLVEEELKVNYGSGKTIFVEHCNDLFADEMREDFIRLILGHCARFDSNTYVFQTKNPARMVELFARYNIRCPNNMILGTTIESNRWHDVMTLAPHPRLRAAHFRRLRAYWPQVPTFVTVEPVLDFDVDKLTEWLAHIKPGFVNIGADSKGHGLNEPSREKLLALIDGLNRVGIPIRQKSNLARLLGDATPKKSS